MKIQIRDTDPAVIAAVKADLGNEQSEILAMVGSITDVEVSALVSPANGFGFMDDGVDLVYSSVFGPELQERLQDRIFHRPIGELLVGEALIIETAHPKIPFLIAAPTRRVSKRVDDPVDIMLACRAAVLIALKEDLASIAFPGMGGGSAQVPPDLAARNMLAGIRKGLAGRAPLPSSLQAVAREEEQLREHGADPTTARKVGRSPPKQ
jgi:O-acetyl-ADP-ribose deacetylase (regulator of RNase III)